MVWGFQVHLGNMKYVLDEPASEQEVEKDFFIENLLICIHFTIEMIWWTGLVPWKFEFPLPGSLLSAFLYSH
jgi:hypothetical protein